MGNKIFVVIPAFNEQRHIQSVVLETSQYCSEIIVVDDGSGDQTSQLARQGGARVLRHRVNLGKGSALKTGCAAALQLGAEIVVLMDADAQHQPRDIPQLVQGVQHGNYDIVFGMRRLNRAMPFSMLAGNKIFSLAIKYLYNFQLTDTQCGFRAFRVGVYPKILWEAQAYDVETEMILNALCHHLRCGGLYIDTIYHDKYKGTTVLDGLRVLGRIISKRFLSFKKL